DGATMKLSRLLEEWLRCSSPTLAPSAERYRASAIGGGIEEYEEYIRLAEECRRRAALGGWYRGQFEHIADGDEHMAQLYDVLACCELRNRVAATASEEPVGSRPARIREV